ncbi:hypothetical protein EDD11_006979 [Mortierella claussenii]|nr:hypothetical protein EDD11_006979 [Mortierella claussenii]
MHSMQAIARSSVLAAAARRASAISAISAAPRLLFVVPHWTRTYSSAASGQDAQVQELVFTTVAELMQIKEPADKARIGLTSQLKSDLGMDIFKTYQLLDQLEQRMENLDISIEEADKAQTLQDIVDLVSRK